MFSKFKDFFYKNTFLVLFLPLVFVYSCWVVLFYPALMSPDSISQWVQSYSLIFGDWHPYLSNMYLTPFYLLFHNPVSVAFFHILVTASFFSYAFTFFIKNKVNVRVMLFLYVFLITSIPISLYSMTIWKDVPFSLALVIGAFLLGKKLYEKSEWTKLNILCLVISLVIVTFFRHNGIVYLFFFPLLFLFYFRNSIYKWKIISLFFLVSFCVVFMFPKIFNFVGGKPFWMNAKDLFAYHMTANVYYYQPQTKVSNKLKTTFESVFDSPENINNYYNRMYWNPLFWNKHINREVLNSHEFWNNLTPEFYKNNFIPNLKYIFRDKLLTFWDITIGRGYNHAILILKDGSVVSVERNESGLNDYHVFPSLTKFFAVNIIKIDNSSAKYFIWNSFVPILLLIFLFFYSFYKNKKYLQIYSIFILLQLPFLIIFNIAGDWRYFYFFYLSFFLTIPFFLLKEDEDNR